MKPHDELQLIAAQIPAGVSVLDVGCGDGQLLQQLARQGCRGTGVEIDLTAFQAALRAGVSVLALDVDTQLSDFRTDSYEYAVLSRTLQSVKHPKQVLAELARIARYLVVSTPNFAYWRNRAHLFLGRMPMSKDLPFAWYETPNLHYSSLTELEPLFAALGLEPVRRIPLDARHHQSRLVGLLPNLLASSAVYVLRTPNADRQRDGA